MSTNDEIKNPSAANILQPAPTTLHPDAIVEELRALAARMGEVTPLTAAQRKALRGRLRTPDPILNASITVIGALDNVSQAVGQPAEGVRLLQDEAVRWGAVEQELRSMLNGVSGANLVRRLRIDLIAAQAYTISSQLARDPANAILLPHVEEIKRLKRFSRRKKAAAGSGSAAPEEPAVDDPGAPGNPKA